MLSHKLCDDPYTIQDWIPSWIREVGPVLHKPELLQLRAAPPLHHIRSSREELLPGMRPPWSIALPQQNYGSGVRKRPVDPLSEEESAICISSSLSLSQ